MTEDAFGAADWRESSRSLGCLIEEVWAGSTCVRWIYLQYATDVGLKKKERRLRLFKASYHTVL
jgi:hypothetical protein